MPTTNTPTFTPVPKQNSSSFINNVTQNAKGLSTPGVQAAQTQADLNPINAGLQALTGFKDKQQGYDQWSNQITQNTIVQKAAKRAADAAALKQQQQSQASNSAGGNYGSQPQQNYANYKVGDANKARATLVNSALSLRGETYAWGGGGYNTRQSVGHAGGYGAGTVGVDCSGLTSYAYSQLGIRLPRTARGQMTIGVKTALQNLRPGDLVVWNNGGHTSMYIGNGQIVESVPRTGPRISTLRPGMAVTGIHLSLSGD